MYSETIEVNGVRYVRENLSPDKCVIVRSRDAGVFVGYLEDRNGDSVRLSNARRIWRWAGAATLSELSQKGTSEPASCKFPASVPSVEVLGVCEIIGVSEAARVSIDSVPDWSEQ